MRVFATSDVHIDYQENRMWLEGLSNFDYQQDILIVAGDLSDQVKLLDNCFRALSRKFYRVLFVTGNHDLWVIRDKNINSIEKFHLIKHIAEQNDILLNTFEHQDVVIVPFMSWYDYSFGEPCDKLKMYWMDYKSCHWPNDMTMGEVTNYFHQQNRQVIDDFQASEDKTVISFSHFLPRLDLMPHYIPQTFRYIFPALGSHALDKQIRLIQPDIHVYGHSHLNRQIEMNGIRYINNAYAYPREDNIALKQLLCIFEN